MSDLQLEKIQPAVGISDLLMLSFIFPRCASFALVNTSMVCDDHLHERCGRTLLVTLLHRQNMCICHS